MGMPSGAFNSGDFGGGAIAGEGSSLESGNVCTSTSFDGCEMPT